MLLSNQQCTCEQSGGKACDMYVCEARDRQEGSMMLTCALVKPETGRKEA